MYTPKARTATSECERHLDAVPEDFDPTENPILAIHYFGLLKIRHAEVINYQQSRLARALHRLAQANGIEVGSRVDILKRLVPPVRGARQ
jgi:hypothetical protein